MSETHSVYNVNGTLLDELAKVKVIKVAPNAYTWEFEGGSATSTEAESIIADDNYDVILADISGSARSGVPIAWAVNSASDFYIVAVCGNQIIDGISDSLFGYEANQKVLWLDCPFENADFWQAYIFRNELPVNNFAVAEGRAKISAIQSQFEKDNRVLRQLLARRFRTLRTPDVIETLPPVQIRAGKVLAFDPETGNPDLTLSKEEVKGAYDARDEALEYRNTTKAYRDEAESFKTDAELAKSQTEEFANQVASDKSYVDEKVSNFNTTVDLALQGVDGVAQSGITAINSVKTTAMAEISSAKTNATTQINTLGSTVVSAVNNSGTVAVNYINSTSATAISNIEKVKDEAIEEVKQQVADAQRVYDEQGNLLTEKIEWRTIKIAEGVYTQKWVKVQ